MCGRYVLFSTAEQLIDAVKQRTNEPRVVMVGDGPRPNYNIAPTHSVPIVRYFNGVPAIGPATWGYPPRTVFNARGETAFELPTFRGSLPCVFLVDGWYEWVDDPNPAPGDRRKQPYFTSLDSGDLIFMAGLCNVFDGVVHATMITNDATPDLAWLHHRMPRMLVGDEVQQWLTGDQATREKIASEPPASGTEELVSKTASKDVGNVANNGERLIAGGVPKNENGIE